MTDKDMKLNGLKTDYYGIPDITFERLILFVKHLTLCFLFFSYKWLFNILTEH